MATRELDKLLLSNYAKAEGITKRFESALAARYRDAFKEIEAQLAVLYGKIGSPPSLLEARRYGRLKSLQNAIAAEYSKLTNRLINGTRENSAAVWSQAAYGTQWAYDQSIGVEIKWPVLPVEAIRASVWNSDSGENYADRYRNWNGQDVRKMQAIVTKGLVLGQGFAKTARQMRDRMNTSYFQTVRIVRTESVRNYTLGHLETYGQAAEAGIEARKRWVATIDTRTRDTHGSLDGKYADDKGLFHVRGLSTEGPGLFGDPANDIACRCRIVEEIDGLAPDLRRIRGEGIVEYTTFDKWASARGWTENGGWPIEAKAKVTAEQSSKY